MSWRNFVFVLSAVRAFDFLSYRPTWKFPNTEGDQWFFQKLDHFDPSNTETWKQRYRVDRTWFDESKNSPVFLIIGGEASIESGNETLRTHGGPLSLYAKTFGALCFILEHRYYGESQPAPDLSVENLRFLSSQQALADIAQFIQGISNLYKFHPTNKWIVFGGSYAGSLAAWSRLKFPHLVHAAVASSAPLQAVVDFKDYYDSVQQVLASSRKSCAENVHQGALHIADLLTDPRNAAVISDKFELCEPLDSVDEKELFSLNVVIMQLSLLVQYYNKFSTNVDDVCDIMVDEDYGSLIDRYAAVNSLVSKYLGLNSLEANKPCLKNLGYFQTVESLKNESYSAIGRQWFYQTCTEFGFCKTSSSRDELFGPFLKLESYVGLCGDVFGEDFNMTRLEEGVQNTNTEYGGVNISVTRVAFVHGSMDPWRVLGIRESPGPEMPVIVIQGASHCNDMLSPEKFDQPNLKAARRQITDILAKWISE